MSDLPPPPPDPQGQPTQPYGYGYGYGPAPQKTNGLAIAALVCGLVGLLFFAPILGPLALIFGLVAISQINKSGGTQKGKRMAIAGVVLGPIDLILWLVWLDQVVLE